MIFCVNQTTTARVYNTTNAATDCPGHFYCTYITFRALGGKKINSPHRGAWRRQISAAGGMRGTKWPGCSSLRFFFLPFILPEFQWPLQATSDCWILRNVLSELYKKPSAQRTQLKTKHANCYIFSLFWVCGKCCTDCFATFTHSGLRGFEEGAGHQPMNCMLGKQTWKGLTSLESNRAL